MSAFLPGDRSRAQPLASLRHRQRIRGGLNTVTSCGGNQFRFVYTLAGQIDSLLLGTGVKEKRSYDGDGRRTFRTRVSSVLGMLVSDTLNYDRMSRIRRGQRHSVEVQ